MDFLPKAKNTHSPTTDQQKRMRKLCRKLMDYPVFQFRKNAKYKVAEIMLMVIDAAMENQSLEAVSSIRGGMSADDALLHLKDKLSIEKIEQMLFELLDQRFLKILRRKFPCFRKWIAIDFTPATSNNSNPPVFFKLWPAIGLCHCLPIFAHGQTQEKGEP